MSTSRFGKKQKPLFVIGGPVKASVYRGKFKPFAVTRLVDLDRIKKARKVSLEVGTIEAAGESATLIAQVEKGMITKLGLHGCPCSDPKRKRRLGKNERKVFAAVKERLSTIRGGAPALPVPFAREADGDIFIPIWPFPPIVIILEPGTWCIAIMVVGHVFCYICFDQPALANCI